MRLLANAAILLAYAGGCGSATAQEMSEASYLGGLDGAVKACAAAFPERAAAYGQAVQALVGCRMSPADIAAWRQRLRDADSSKRQYAEGFAQALKSLSEHPGNRARQCASLDTLRCDPSAAPSPAAPPPLN